MSEGFAPEENRLVMVDSAACVFIAPWIFGGFSEMLEKEVLSEDRGGRNKGTRSPR